MKGGGYIHSSGLRCSATWNTHTRPSIDLICAAADGSVRRQQNEPELRGSSLRLS